MNDSVCMLNQELTHVRTNTHGCSANTLRTNYIQSYFPHSTVPSLIDRGDNCTWDYPSSCTCYDMIRGDNVLTTM